MRSFSLIALLSVISAVVAQDTDVAQVVQAFTSANLTSRLGLTFNPTAILGVTFTQNGQAVSFKAGEKVQRSATAQQPKFSLIGSTDPGPFVVVMTDPDAPTPQNPTYGQVRHYLGGNWYPNGASLQNRSASITSYFQPSPGVGSPAHRYTFLLYKQPDTFNQQRVITAQTPIVPFNVTQFASQVGLGNPLAGTFMMVTQP